MDNVSDLIFPYRAHVRRVDVRQPDLLAMLKASGMVDPAILDERAPFFWMAEISNDGLDAYFTHMLPSTLNNFAAAARAGVSFINSHRHMELPFGRSLDGRTENDGDKMRVLADFYTLPGLTLNGVTTDDFIAGVRSGIISDVSVGFYGGTQTCDLCGRDYFSWDCPHLAGLKYEVKEGDVVRQVLATVSIDNAKLSEVSAVYDGATPDAAIVKARNMAEAGTLKPDAARALEARYRMRFDTKRTFAGVETPGKGKTMEYEQIVNQVRETLGLAADADVPGAVAKVAQDAQRLTTVEAKLTEAEKRINELEPQAAIGAQYRTDLIAEALAEGVRAYGDKFSNDTYKRMLEGLDLNGIKQLKADWEAMGNSRFNGGRKTTDAGEDAPNGKQQRTSKLPAQAHKV